ncbi:MAG: DegT/DnrJ/EryC1/StrS family aminotransferase [Solirubrobacteraceae bacterium]
MPAVPFADLTRQHEPMADELRAIFDRLVGSSAFVLGEEVEQFEANFAAYCGVRQCVGVASGTAALTIMLMAAGIGRGDEVIVPAHTFIASALAVRHAGARVAYADVQPGSGLIDPTAAAAALSPQTVAILAVHLYGQTCSMEPLRALAERHGLLLLEDAAQAHGALYGTEVAGGLGHAAAFSFYPSKNLGALGDGGAICTDDAGLAGRARQLRDLGRDGAGAHRLLGYNERLDGLQAAFLRAKLAHLDQWIYERRVIAREYGERLNREVELLEESPQSPCTYHVFPIRVSGRDRLRRALGRHRIATSIHYPLVLPDQPSLCNLYPSRPVDTARNWAKRELSLPIFPGMTEHEIDHVASIVNKYTSDRRSHGLAVPDGQFASLEPSGRQSVSD